MRPLRCRRRCPSAHRSAVVSMGIDRGGAGLQPDAWRTRSSRDRLSDHAGRQHARLQDLLSIGGSVSTVDTAAGQIDHDVAAIDLTLPVAEGRTVPGDDAPRPDVGTAAQDDHVVAVAVKCPRENRPDLSRSTWNDDLHSSLLALARPGRGCAGLRPCSNINEHVHRKSQAAKTGSAAGADRPGRRRAGSPLCHGDEADRRAGYEATTLRDIAKAAGVSVGLSIAISRANKPWSSRSTTSSRRSTRARRRTCPPEMARPLHLRPDHEPRRPRAASGGSPRAHAGAGWRPRPRGFFPRGRRSPASASSRSLSTQSSRRAMHRDSRWRKRSAGCYTSFIWPCFCGGCSTRVANQRATAALVSLTQQLLPSAALALRVPPVRRFVISVDELARQALFADPATP